MASLGKDDLSGHPNLAIRDLHKPTGEEGNTSVFLQNLSSHSSRFPYSPWV